MIAVNNVRRGRFLLKEGVPKSFGSYCKWLLRLTAQLAQADKPIPSLDLARIALPFNFM